MTNVAKTLESLNVSTTCRIQGVQAIRKRIENDRVSIIAGASRFIQSVVDKQVSFDNDHLALWTAQYLYSNLFDAKYQVDNVDAVIMVAKEQAQKMLNSPQFAFVSTIAETRSSGYQAEPTEQKEVVAGLDVKVAVNKEGKIKRGGKKELAIRMYVQFVRDAENPLDRAGFKALMKKDLGMNDQGAQTYVYNCFSENGAYRNEIAAIPKI